MRLGGECDRDHLVGRRHFEIQRLANGSLQPLHVVVADVAAIFAQMRGDPVGAGGNGEQGRAQRIWHAAAARIAQGRDMIDIDAEAQRRDPPSAVHPFDFAHHRLCPQLRDDAVQMFQIGDFEIDDHFAEVRREYVDADVVDIGARIADDGGDHS